MRFIRDRREWQVIDPAIQADFDAIAKVRDGDFDIVSRDHADRKWIVAYIVDDGPVCYHLYDRGNAPRDAPVQQPPAAGEAPACQDAGGELSLRATDSNCTATSRFPSELRRRICRWCCSFTAGHGARDVWGLNNEAQWLANRGYAVLQVNFRGSTGYGKQHLNAGDREWGGKMHDDLVDAKNWAVKQGYADPKRVCHLRRELRRVCHACRRHLHARRVRRGGRIVGPSSLVTLIQSIPPYWAPVTQSSTSGWATSTRRRSSSSRAHRSTGRTRSRMPLLVAQGANDPRVKQAESDQIVAAVRKNSKEVEYLVFPDEGHGFARPENRLKFYAAMEGFLARHFGTPAEPASERENSDDLRK